MYSDYSALNEKSQIIKFIKETHVISLILSCKHFKQFCKNRAASTDMDKKKLLNKVLFLFYLRTKKYSFSVIKLRLNHITWTILTMYLLPFWALIFVVPLLSM